MMSISTIEEGVEYLKGHGFQAMSRDWAMGLSLFAFVGQSQTNGLSLSDFGLYIYSKNGQWFVVIGQGQEAGFPDLTAAVLFAEGKLRRVKEEGTPS